MRFRSFVLASMVALSAVPAIAAVHKHRPVSLTRTSRMTSRAASRTSSKASAKHAAKPRIIGQRTIDDARASEIQTALIKAGYLSGEPSGHWDSESENAMQKLQSDNGWQTKLVPDSRALIKLGLGPGSGPNASLSSTQSGTFTATGSSAADNLR